MIRSIWTIRSVSALFLAAVMLAADSNSARAAGVGHGGGAGHVAARPGGFYGGARPGFYGGRGYYGYPYGYGYGFGLGLGLGYGMGYGYPYYGYGGYYPGYAYPAYVYPGYAPVPVPYPAPGTDAPPPTRGTVGTPPVNSARADVVLNVQTPAEASVWINGIKTNQSGPHREFVSSGLEPGRSYTFEIRALWLGADGRAVDISRRVAVQAGERRVVDLAMPATPQSDVAPVAAQGEKH